jgi:hypothetical protein
MSLAMIQAVKSLQTSPTQKLLLLVLADCHNEKTGQCNPSYRYLMEISGLSNKAVANNLKALRNSGSVTFDSRNGANTHYELTPERFNPVNLVHQFEGESSEPSSPVNLVTSEPSSQAPVNLVPSTSEPRSKSSELGSHKPERTGNITGSEPSKNSKKPKSEGCLTFPDKMPDGYREPLTTWWNHKREKGQTYKPTGWATLVKQQMRKPLAQVIRDVENSVANNYAGIFAAREQFQSKSRNQAYNQKSATEGASAEDIGTFWEGQK